MRVVATGAGSSVRDWMWPPPGFAVMLEAAVLGGPHGWEPSGRVLCTPNDAAAFAEAVAASGKGYMIAAARRGSCCTASIRRRHVTSGCPRTSAQGLHMQCKTKLCVWMRATVRCARPNIQPCSRMSRRMLQNSGTANTACGILEAQCASLSPGTYPPQSCA